MKKNSNAEYILNSARDIPVTHWIYDIQGFFGKETSEEFFEKFIEWHKILRLNDIRNIIATGPLSVYAMSQNEQLAFISNYKVIDSENDLVKKLGFETVQKQYRNKIIDLSKQIKKLGSFSTTFVKWKDKNKRDTYQKERIFIIYSENNTPEEFKNKIMNLAKSNNISSVLITDPLLNDAAKLKITSKLYDVATGDILQEYEDTTIEVVEKYLGSLSDTKVYFKIPYERNKTILCLDDKRIPDYYSKDKQEKIRKTRPNSFNSGMLKQSLINNFNKKDYNT